MNTIEHDILAKSESVLILKSESKKNRDTCNGCIFNKSRDICLDENFTISSKYGFEGGCDNPRKDSGIFVLIDGV